MNPYIKDVLNRKILMVDLGESITEEDGRFTYRKGSVVAEQGLVDMKNYTRTVQCSVQVDYALATLYFGDFLYVALANENMASLWKTDRNRVIDLFSQLMSDWGFIKTAPRRWFEAYMEESEDKDIKANSNSIGVVKDENHGTRAIVQVTDSQMYIFTHKDDFEPKRNCRTMSMPFSWSSESAPFLFGTDKHNICEYREQVIAGALAASGIRLRKDLPIQIIDKDVDSFEYMRSEDTDIYEKLGDIYKFNSYIFMV